MKKIVIISAMSLFLWYSTPAFSQDKVVPPPTAATTKGVVPDEMTPLEAEVLREPLFSLEAKEGDSPATIQKKAALRLFKGYSVTVGLLSSCQGKTPHEVEKALSTFYKRNGTTLGLIMATIKRLEGFNKEIKTVLDTAITSEVMVGVPNCQTFCQEVLNGHHNIYSSPKYLNDYNMVRNKTPLPILLPIPPASTP